MDCGAKLSEEANFCSVCGRPVHHSPSVPPPAGSVWAPPHLMQRILASRASLEGERKLVTVLFADLRGSLGVLAGADPEDSQALLDAVLAAMVEAVHRYEGAVNQVMGDGIMALFGAPVMHEDHAVRAACAALAMQETVRGLRDASWEARGARPQIRVGLHSGEVAIRTVRNDLSMDYRAVGPTTHIAARMEQLATPGSVWLTQETFKLGQGLLRTNLIGPMRVKGVALPIEVHELTGISVRTRFQANALRGLSPLAGRENTLVQLQRSLELAANGSSQVAVLAGQPGVGKSRLCYELLHLAADRFRVLEASALSYLSARPHGLLASMVRSLFGIDDDDDLERLVAKAQQCLSELGGDLSHQLHVALELLDVPSRDREWARLDPVQKRRKIEELLRALLAAWCARGPTVLLCEDLHWCDEDSLAFISGLVEHPPGPGALLLLTHRLELTPPWSTHPHVLSCRIGALDPATAEALLATLLGEKAALAPLRSWLAARTDGNPFFIEESARAVLDSGLLFGVTGALVSERVDVPASIDALLSARIDRLPEAARELIQAAAVLGDDGPAEVLRAVTGQSPDEFARQLDVLKRAELLYDSVALTREETRPQLSAATFRFKHALIQEVVYKRLVRPRKRSLHARVVDVMERQYSARLAEHVEQLAEHSYRAELWDKCAEYQKRACIRAASRSANGVAIAHLERGIEALTHLPDGPENARAAVDLRLTALAALLPMGAHERVIQLLREAEQHATQLQDLGRLARVSCQLCTELWCTGRYVLARESAQQALAYVLRLEGDQFALEIAVRYNIAMVQHATADFDAARQGLHALLAKLSGAAASRRLGWAGYPSVMIRTFIISVAAMTGSFEEAERTFEEGRALAEKFDHAFSRTMIMEQAGMCLLVQGEPAVAARWLREALQVCDADEVQTMLMPIASHLGLALLELGEVAEANQLIARAMSGDMERAGHYAIDYLTIARSEAQRCNGDFARAREIAEEAVRETDVHGEPGFHVRALVQLARVLADRTDEQAHAIAIYNRAQEHAQRLGMPPWCALAAQGRGLVHEAQGQRELAARSFDTALDIWVSLKAPARIAQVSAWRARVAG